MTVYQEQAVFYTAGVAGGFLGAVITASDIMCICGRVLMGLQKASSGRGSTNNRESKIRSKGTRRGCGWEWGRLRIEAHEVKEDGVDAKAGTSTHGYNHHLLIACVGRLGCTLSFGAILLLVIHAILYKPDVDVDYSGSICE